MLYKFKQILRKVIPYKFILLTHKFRAVLAAIVYGSQGQKTRATGVARTKGKTTISENLSAIRFQKCGGRNA